jgi:DNA end-binding protein Ku
MWSGFLSFGLVNVPVGMYSATADQTVHFNQLHKGTSNRVRYKKVDEATGEELELEDIVNGYEISPGEYVVVTRDELKEAAPGKSDTIEISDFVDLDDIDPKYFRSTYYLAPKGKGADRAYALLRQSMREANKVGIATVVIRDKEHLVAVRPADDVLILETMFFQSEIRDARDELETLPPEMSFQEREVDIARQLIDMLTTEWEPDRYQNTYRERLEELIDRKREGKAIVFHSEPTKSNVVDLMAALEASVAKTGRRPTRDAPVVAKAPPEQEKVAARAVTGARHVHRAAAPTTKAELVRLAKDRGLEVDAKATKAELEALLANGSGANGATAKKRAAGRSRA